MKLSLIAYSWIIFFIYFCSILSLYVVGLESLIHLYLKQLLIGKSFYAFAF
jgi:hypothetical protein